MTKEEPPSLYEITPKTYKMLERKEANYENTHSRGSGALWNSGSMGPSGRA